MRRLVLALALSLAATYVARGDARSEYGGFCCGDGDCFIIPDKHVRATREGWLIRFGGRVYIIPPLAPNVFFTWDNRYRICFDRTKKPWKRRCFFRKRLGA